MTQVDAQVWLGKDVRKKNALVDLEPILVSLLQVRFRCELRFRRHKSRKSISCGRHELVDPNEMGALRSETVIQLTGISIEKPLTRVPTRGQERLSSGSFHIRSGGLGWKRR
jgi:hypothetical protein